MPANYVNQKDIFSPNITSTHNLGNLKENSKRPYMVPIDSYLWDKLRKRCLYMTLAVTPRCNMDCSVCIMYDREGKAPFQELSKDDVKYVMQKLGSRKKKIILFGGEPTLRNDIEELINIIKNSGNIPMLYTNGVKLADKNYVKMLSEAGLEKVYLSLDSLTEEGTEILQGDGSFLPLKLQAMENLKRYGNIKFWLSSMIAYGVNHTEIPDLINEVIKDKSGLLKGIYLLAATDTEMSWYQLSSKTDPEFNYILEEVEKATGGKISVEYMKEFTDLKVNLNKILNYFNARFPYTPDRALARKENGTVEPIISLEEIKEINKAIENKRFTKLIKYIFRYKEWLTLLGRVFNPTTVEFEAYTKKNVIFIEPSYMTVRPLESLMTRGMTNMVKNETGYHLYAQGPA